MHTCACVHTCVHTCMHTCILAYMHVCVCITKQIPEVVTTELSYFLFVHRIQTVEADLNTEVDSLKHPDGCEADALAMHCFLNNVVSGFFFCMLVCTKSRILSLPLHPTE